MGDSIGKAYKPWLIASLTVLVGSLLLLGVMGTFAFLTVKAVPLWVVVLGVVAALGIAVGFAGFFVMMVMAGWRSWQEQRRVQVIPPGRSAGK